MALRRIYLDNAATSWPKPPEVVRAVQRYLTENGAPAGRGMYREALAVEQLLLNTRSRLARLIHAQDARSIVFAFSGTDALNIAIFGAICAGQRVLTTASEHNSVLRPLHHLRETRNIQVDYLPCNGNGLLDLEALHARLPGCDWLVLNHGSNVTGAVAPLAEFTAAARKHGVKVMVDAAQTVGSFRVDVSCLGIDLLAASGHKGLLGPLGTGFLYISPALAGGIAPFRFGGTGTASDSEVQPTTLPERLEAGNLNMPGIAGLAAGLEFLEREGIERIHNREMLLRRQLVEGLGQTSRITCFAATDACEHTGVVSFAIDGFDPREAAAVLADSFGVQLRAGMHCAPRMHALLGTSPAGTIRVGIGPFTTEDDIDQLLVAVRELASV